MITHGYLHTRRCNLLCLFILKIFLIFIRSLSFHVFNVFHRFLKVFCYLFLLLVLCVLIANIYFNFIFVLLLLRYCSWILPFQTCSRFLPCFKFEPRHDKINQVTVRPAKTQISLGIRLAWSESSLYAYWIAKDPSFFHAHSEDSDQTGRMPRLIWVFTGNILIVLVLSCRGSFALFRVVA